MKNLIYILTFIIVSITSSFFSQTDTFDKFQTLTSKGDIPYDFYSLTYKKIKKDIKEHKKELSKSDEKIFLKGIHYGIDEILHSGMVLYGDQISTYVKNIADHLLKNNEELKNKLRFYTLKSNEVNAFSTDQGIVFITTGLISKLENEAQLAFILGHEISHYTEKHVINSFKFKKNANNDDNIKTLSIYSKENEVTADKIGLKLYYEAGYSDKNITGVFDVLMYSNYPFEELVFKTNYFNYKDINFDDTLFNFKILNKDESEDYDDSNSSHPNIRKRKDNILLQKEQYEKWGNNTSLFGNDEFKHIQTLCRFESIRTDVLNSNYIDAFYSIYILENYYPNSTYLKHMKAKSLLGIINTKNDINKNDINKKKGNIGPLYNFFVKANLNQIGAITLNYINSLDQNLQINELYNYIIKSLASDKNFNLDQEPNSELYISIKNILEEKIIKDKISKYRSDYLKKERLKDEFDKLTRRKQKKAIKHDFYEFLKSYQLDLDTLIIVEPMVISYKKKEIDLLKSEKLKHNYSEVINSSSILIGLNPIIIDRDNLYDKGTNSYNERSLLIEYMKQISSNDYAFPVDYEELQELKRKYNTNKILFTVVTHRKEINADLMGLSILLYPALPIILAYAILTKNESRIHLNILDLNDIDESIYINYSFNDKPNKHNLGARMYDVFNHFKVAK